MDAIKYAICEERNGDGVIVGVVTDVFAAKELVMKRLRETDGNCSLFYLPFDRPNQDVEDYLDKLFATAAEEYFSSRDGIEFSDDNCKDYSDELYE